MTEKESVFRKQSIDSVSSPEQLSDYIRSATPSVWFIMIAVIFLLVGVCVWGVFGRLDTNVTSVAVCRNGTLTMILSADYKDRVEPGMIFTVEGVDYTIRAESEILITSEDGYDAYALRKAGLAEGDFGVTLISESDLPDGAYNAVITLESISPISLVIN